MNYLLDTCVISEYAQRTPHPKVLHCIDELNELKTFLSALTIGEIKKGIDLLPVDSRRKGALTVWLYDGLLKRFAGRIYPITVDVMLRWGALFAVLEANGHNHLLFSETLFRLKYDKIHHINHNYSE